MMARALAFAVLLAAAGAQHCSSVCGTCCPGADLVIDDTGDCWRGAQLVCRVATAACNAGTAAEQCPSVGVADISITEPDNVAGLPSGVVIASAVGRQVPVDAVDSFLREGQAVWEKLALAATGGNVAALHNVPTYYVGRFQVKMPVKTRLRAGSVVRYLCPDKPFFGIPATPCHVVVLLYECYPCPSRKGGLPQHLLTEGFARTRCAPTFTNGRTRTEHPLGAYVKMIQPGITEVIVLPEVVEFVMFALSYGGAVDCATLKTKLGCTLLSHNFCVWRGSCEMNMCVQQGPSKDPVSPGRGGCNTRVCLKKELR
eukprot:TRINITY_DN426_c0_g1_i1.p1 TRINITY_DN426_c0_g1~~TRINITY_DN426_c0_g1_i1.p1  ORF type:complete len:314 (+),score=112.58 TRINITY_DN426_c0_g1_i1:70-1011(+)